MDDPRLIAFADRLANKILQANSSDREYERLVNDNKLFRSSLVAKVEYVFSELMLHTSAGILLQAKPLVPPFPAFRKHDDGKEPKVTQLCAVADERTDNTLADNSVLGPVYLKDAIDRLWHLTAEEKITQFHEMELPAGVELAVNCGPVRLVMCYSINTDSYPIRLDVLAELPDD